MNSGKGFHASTTYAFPPITEVALAVLARLRVIQEVRVVGPSDGENPRQWEEMVPFLLK